MPAFHSAPWPAGLALAALLLPAAPAAAADGIEQRVLQAIRTAREQAGLEPLERRPVLDAVARERAELVAAAPREQRLSVNQPIEPALQRFGAAPHRRVVPYLVLKHGYDDYAQAILDGWRAEPGRWREVLSESNDGIGLAVTTAADGWVIMVAILVEDAVVLPPPERVVLERETLEAVNAVRREHGLNELVEDELLTKIAREHSEDMARRQYFAHVSPEGARAQDRVQRHSVAFARLGENIHKSKGMADLEATAVESWMASRPHRKTILTPEYTRTGLGVAFDADGAAYFTQLFLLPPD